MKNLGEQPDGRIILKPQTDADKEVLIHLLSESVSICPRDFGLKCFVSTDCNVFNCKKCWEEALASNEE